MDSSLPQPPAGVDQAAWIAAYNVSGFDFHDIEAKEEFVLAGTRIPAEEKVPFLKWLAQVKHARLQQDPEYKALLKSINVPTHPITSREYIEKLKKIDFSNRKTLGDVTGSPRTACAHHMNPEPITLGTDMSGDVEYFWRPQGGVPHAKYHDIDEGETDIDEEDETNIDEDETNIEEIDIYKFHHYVYSFVSDRGVTDCPLRFGIFLGHVLKRKIGSKRSETLPLILFVNALDSSLWVVLERRFETDWDDEFIASETSTAKEHLSSYESGYPDWDAMRIISRSEVLTALDGFDTKNFYQAKCDNTACMAALVPDMANAEDFQQYLESTRNRYKRPKL